MNNEENTKGNNFMNGFMWGAILAGGLVYLLTTKKGKKLLQAITEEGAEGVGDIEQLLEELENDGDGDMPEPPLRPQPTNGSAAHRSVSQEQTNGHTNGSVSGSNGHQSHRSTLSKLSSTSRRFFKGTKK
jgi:gas vesicle protein